MKKQTRFYCNNIKLAVDNIRLIIPTCKGITPLIKELPRKTKQKGNDFNTNVIVTIIIDMGDDKVNERRM